jgi:hypothetical protein
MPVMTEMLPYIITAGIGLLGFIGSFAVRVLSRMSTSIGSLNEKMGIVVAEVSHNQKAVDRHEERLDGHDSRLRQLEMNLN